MKILDDDLSSYTLQELLVMRKKIDNMTHVMPSHITCVNRRILLQLTPEQLLRMHARKEISITMLNDLTLQEREDFLIKCITKKAFLNLSNLFYSLKKDNFKKKSLSLLKHIQHYRECYGVKDTVKFLVKHFRREEVEAWMSDKKMGWNLPDLLEEPRISSHIHDIEKCHLKDGYNAQIRYRYDDWRCLDFKKWFHPLTDITDVTFIFDKEYRQHASVTFNNNFIGYLRDEARLYGYLKALDIMLVLNNHLINDKNIDPSWIDVYMKDDDFVTKMPNTFRLIQQRQPIRQAPNVRHIWPLVEKWMYYTIPEFQTYYDICQTLHIENIDALKVYTIMVEGGFDNMPEEHILFL